MTETANAPISEPEERQLNALVATELFCLESLLTALDKESDALIDLDIEALERATQEKNMALSHQLKATTARQGYTKSLNASNRDKSDIGGELQQLIPRLHNKDTFAAAITQLQNMAKQCQTMNRNNGRLISQKQLYTRNALDILRQADSKPSTYSNQGDTINKTEGRILGKA